MFDKVQKRAELLIVVKVPMEGETLTGASIFRDGWTFPAAEEERIQRVKKIGNGVYEVETASYQYIAFAYDGYPGEYKDVEAFIARLPILPGGQKALTEIQIGSRISLKPFTENSRWVRLYCLSIINRQML